MESGNKIVRRYHCYVALVQISASVPSAPSKTLTLSDSLTSGTKRPSLQLLNHPFVMALAVGAYWTEEPCRPDKA